MAQRTIRVDDLDGATEGARSVSFSLEGTTYDIDLCEANIEMMRVTLSPYIAVARPRAKQVQNKQGVGTDKEQLKEIRRWAHQHGFEFSDRGRIPIHIMDVYQKMAGPPRKGEVAASVLSNI